ncbi:hypothetical protein CIK75_13615 [Glutamicibacter sp. BW78]|nr:hypothetical protein CIK75_13615 [Glutamicibacter sp. BW78]
MPHAPRDFEYSVGGGSVVIFHQGRRASTLRGTAASRFLRDVETQEPQALMARVTGNYKHGNERVAQSHPRNRA